MVPKYPYLPLLAEIERKSSSQIVPVIVRERTFINKFIETIEYHYDWYNFHTKNGQAKYNETILYGHSPVLFTNVRSLFRRFFFGLRTVRLFVRRKMQ